MAERIVTDGDGDRWDVRQDGEGEAAQLTFRHQGGATYRVAAPQPLDALSDDRLLEALDRERKQRGEAPVGEGGDDRGADPEDYITS